MISLRLVLRQEQAEAWPCTLITPDPEDECFICKETFTTDPCSEVCRAIRLSCGHLVGHRCFAEWIRRRPKTCPLLSHPLHPQKAAVRQAKPCRNPRSKACLRWLVNTWVFEHYDDFINKNIIPTVGDEVGLAEFERRMSLLSGQSLSDESARKSLDIAIRMSTIAALCYWFLLSLLAALLCSCSLVLTVVFFESARNWTYSLGWIWWCFYVIVFSGVNLAITFGLYVVIVACLLREGVARGLDQDQDSGPSFHEVNGQLLLIV
jgi:hypothetical protein